MFGCAFSFLSPVKIESNLGKGLKNRFVISNCVLVLYMNGRGFRNEVKGNLRAYSFFLLPFEYFIVLLLGMLFRWFSMYLFSDYPNKVCL